MLPFVTVPAALLFAFLPWLVGGAHTPPAYIVRNTFYCIALPLLSAYVDRRFTAKLSGNMGRLATLFAFIASQFIVIGQMFYFANSMNVYGSTLMNVAAWLGQSAVWFVVMRPLVAWTVGWFNRPRVQCDSRLNLWRLFLVALLARLAALFWFYPCIYDWDAIFSMRTMLNPGEILSNHHPYFVAATQAAFWRLGQAIAGRPDIGMALLALIWATASSAIVAYAAATVRSMRLSAAALRIIAYSLALFPLFVMLGVAPVKDSIFSYSMLLYLACLLRLNSSHSQCLRHPGFLAVFIAAMTVVCFSRSQGVIIVAAATVVALICWPGRLRMAGACAIPFALVAYTHICFLPARNVQTDTRYEAYNMLFQQTALYLKTFPNDITDDERHALSTLFDIEIMSRAYRPDLTDPAKWSYHFGITDKQYNDHKDHFMYWSHEGESEAYAAYRRAWFAMFLRHPDVYVDAHLAVVYPFFYGGRFSVVTTDIGWPKSSSTMPEYSFYTRALLGVFLAKSERILSKAPVTDLIFAIFPYVWAALFLLLFLCWRKDWRSLVAFLPVALSLLFLCVCPVASARYAYPVIFTLPLLFAFCIKPNPNTTHDV